MRYSSIKEVFVALDFGEAEVPVGRLALKAGVIYFEYEQSFIKTGIEISPIRLPLQSGVKAFDRFMFEGLVGVFNDSLPDGWGRLLLDRALRNKGVLPDELTALDRLAHVGKRGMGALVYHPDYSDVDTGDTFTLDTLSMHAQEVLDGTSDDVLEELIALNGSSAGARPKALIGVNDKRNHIIHGQQELPEEYSHWLVKFANIQDGTDAGAIEYVYSLMAKEAGIEMPDTHLFPAQKGAGYFAVKRFDRNGKERYHVHSACGLLHSDFRTSSLDYEDIIALTEVVTKDVREVEKMYRLAVFNVMAHNRDDHSKNFSFIMDKTGEWKMSPAYDLTFSSGPRGEQSTMVLGEGKNPTAEHLLLLAEKTGIGKDKGQEIIEKTKDVLSNWGALAKEYDVSSSNIKLIKERIE